METRDQKKQQFSPSKQEHTKDMPSRQTGDRSSKEMSPKKPNEVELPIRERGERSDKERHDENSRPQRTDRNERPGQGEHRTH